MSTSSASRAQDIERAARRGMLVLIGAQVVGGLGLASGVAVGALIASELLADSAMAGVPFAASIAGTTIAALPLFAYMRRAGRRAGLRLGWLLGAAGAAFVVAATLVKSVPLLLVGMALFGCANAASDAARYAAGDLAVRRGRAMGILVFATTLTAIIGPNLLGPAGRAATQAGLPGHAGPFLVSAIVFGGAALLLDRLLRPDPLVVRARRSSGADVGAPTSPDLSQPSWPAARPIASMDRPAWALGVGTLAMAVANFAMIFAMTAAPAQLGMAGHGLTIIGLIVSLHIGAMFAPSPLSGFLSDRIGPAAVIFIAALAIAASGPLIAAGGASSGGSGHLHPGAHTMDPTVLTLGLVLLGVGWNFAFIGGSALLGQGPASDAQLRAQGLAEMVRGIAALAGALVSGIVLAQAGLAGIGAVTVGTAVPLVGLAIVDPVRRLLQLDPEGRRNAGDGTLVARSGRPG